MNLNKQIENTLHAYIHYLNKGSIDEIIALYAEDATLEDPVGQPSCTGRDAIANFYRNGLGQTSVTAELNGPVRVTDSGWGAIAFRVTVAGNPTTTIDVIDVMQFNGEGKIQSMQAYWGTGNVSTSQP